MLTLDGMTRYQALRWLMRKDPEAKWFWVRKYLFTKSNLVMDVTINIKDFGILRNGYWKIVI